MTKKGLLLVNLGTPQAPTPSAVKTYLKKFLSDQRVIRMNPLIWQPILRGMILPRRAARSAEKYQKIWDSQKGSPLLYYTKEQALDVQGKLPEYTVRYAMSYSNPSIPAALSEFEHLQVQDLTVIPLYPHYSTTTVASVQDSIHRYYLSRQVAPNLHLVSDYCDYPPYIEALAKLLQRDLAKYQPDCLVFSYHGIPQSYSDSGDPYIFRCHKTTQALVAKLKITLPYFESYQSRFGPNEWIKPATDETIKSLPAKGYKNVLVLAPSFVSDCLETLLELNEENRHYFMAAGGSSYHVVSCLNDDPDWISALSKLTLSMQ